MKKGSLQGYCFLFVLGLGWLVSQQGPRPLPAGEKGGVPSLDQRLATLEAAVNTLERTNTDQAGQITALTNRLDETKARLDRFNSRLIIVEDKTVPITVVDSSFYITGMNVFVEDGSGSTNSSSGLGNLTIGYNGSRGGASDRRTGTHNLILGDQNNFTSFGGLVAGTINEIGNEYTTVTGGAFNTASGNVASVSGGVQNEATGIGASVSGGNDNVASGLYGSISGGIHNRASGDYSAVSGGVQRSAPGRFNWAAGGLFQDQ